MDATKLVDYAKSLDCIHCGLCLDTCPTYRMTGVETSSPRGRIHLMRAVAEATLEPDLEYANELDFCLVCRHCESVCPAGVEFGQMMEFARDALPLRQPRSLLARALRWLGFRVVLPRRGVLRLAGSLLGLAQRFGLVQLFARFGGARGEALRHLPLVPPGSERRLLPEHTPGSTGRGAILLEGCVMPELFARVNRATLASLAALGVECRTLTGSVCCGALHAHNGDREGARELARKMIVAHEETARRFDGPVPIVSNSAGCGAHMRELENLFPDDTQWAERARAFSDRMVDFSEHVLELLETDGTRPSVELEGTVVWDAPCHLCHGQGVRNPPKALLDRIDGLHRVPLEDEESCCGSAGIYSLLRPEDSTRVLDPKLDALEKSGATTLVTSNPGCQLQWETGIARRGLRVRVRHLAELVAEGLSRS